MALGLLAVFIALLTVLCIFFTTRVVNRAAARRRGCDLPTQRRVGDPIFAIRRRLQDSDSTKKFRTLPDSALLHQQYGKTFCESTLFSTTFKTSSAENIQAVYGPKAKDFGVQPFRLAGMRPFCGEGLLTTDGPVWERSRSLVKPIFRKSVVSNFGPFKKSVENLIARIPNDGSTIDLQPLVSLMVGVTLP